MTEIISKKQLREFGFLIGFLLPFLIGWLLPAIGGHEFREWTIWVGIVSISLAMTYPRLLYYPYKAWMILGHALGWVNSRVILGLVFITVLLPIAFSMRIFGYDPLRRQRKGELTYREIRKDSQIDYTRIF